jgi:hypothetical protein
VNKKRPEQKNKLSIISKQKYKFQFKTLKFFKRKLKIRKKFLFNHLKNKPASLLFLYLNKNKLEGKTKFQLIKTNQTNLAYNSIKMSYIKQLYIRYNKILSILASIKKFSINNKSLKAQFILKLICYNIHKKNIIRQIFVNEVKNFVTKNHIESLISKNLSLKLKKGFSYKYYCSMLYFNSYIFNTNNILPLKEILKKIYNKKIELNIINLNYLYLDSNIFAEAITRKLKDRQKRVLRVLKLGLNLTKKPYFKIHFHKENIKMNFMFCDKKLDIKIKSNALVSKKNTM